MFTGPQVHPVGNAEDSALGPGHPPGQPLLGALRVVVGGTRADQPLLA